MGDSWGKYYMEYALLRKKHTVFNQSLYGGTNTQTLDDGIHFLQHTADFLKIDLIIWFQTEYIRDLTRVKPTNNYDDILERVDQYLCDKILKIKSSTPNSKWAVIGGHSKLYKPKNYHWAEYMKIDWRSELLNKELPDTQAISHSTLNELSHIYDFDIDVLTRELKKYEIILNAVLSRPDIFYDGVHPEASNYEHLWSQIESAIEF